MNINWESKEKTSTPYTNNYKNVKFNNQQSYTSYNLKINELEENPYIFKENGIPLKTDDIYRNIMYANKQAEQNMHFKHYNTRKNFDSPFYTNFKKKSIEPKEDKKSKFDFIEILNEKIEYKPKRLEIKENIQDTNKYKLENPTYADKTYTLDRYYFI